MTDPRLDKIAEFHFKYVDEHGGTTGDCSECGWTWPCATYRWATADPSVIRADCTWDLDECEFDYIHPGTDTCDDGSEVPCDCPAYLGECIHDEPGATP